MPQVRAIKTLGSIVDQMSGAVDELDRSVTAGLAGAAQIQQNVDVLISGTNNIKGVTVELSGYLDPVRGWMGDVPNCPADMLCVAAGKVIDPVDRVVDDVKLLTDGLIASPRYRARRWAPSPPRRRWSLKCDRHWPSCSLCAQPGNDHREHPPATRAGVGVLEESQARFRQHRPGWLLCIG